MGDEAGTGALVGHVADTGVFIWIGGPQADTPGPSKYDTFGQLAVSEGIVLTISQHAYNELTDHNSAGDTSCRSFIDAAIADGWVEVFDQLDFSIGAVSTVLNRAENLIAQRDAHHQTTQDARADASLLAIATQMIESQETKYINVYTTDKAQSETAIDILKGRYGDRIEVHYCVPFLEQGISVEEFRRLWET